MFRFVILGFLAAAFSTLGSIHAAAQTKDNRDYCAPGGRTVIFLIDVTTPYDEKDKSVIIRLIDNIFSSIKGGDKFVIRTIADSHTRSDRLLDRCIPHCSADSALDRLFKCSDGVIKSDYRAVREQAIGSLKKRLANFEDLPHSDIVRTIFTVANENAHADGRLSIYVYSDLIENSDYFSSRYLFSYPLARLIYGLHHYRLIANLKGADVHVSGVGRTGTRERRPLSIRELNKLIEFWDAYFKESGASSVAISQDAASAQPSTYGQR